MRLSAVWAVLALSGAVVGCRTNAPRPVNPAPQAPWFAERAAASGIRRELGHHGKSPLTIREVMGTGVAVADFDSDGHDDLFLVGQSGVGNSGKCALYRNLGDGSFRDVTRDSGLDAAGYFMGCAVGDFDNDGRPDLLVTGYGATRLYRNRGGFRFQNVTRTAHINPGAPSDWTSAAAFGDVDGDGWLDLYVGRYVTFDSKTRQLCLSNGVTGSCPPYYYQPQRGTLYRNQRDGTFRDVTSASGLAAQHGKTLGALFGDFDGDGHPDLYLGNDALPCDLFRNLGGRFREEGSLRGAAFKDNGQVQSAMGVASADFDGDGQPDIAVTTFQDEPLSLYRNVGGRTFAHAEQEFGVDGSTRPLLGFGICAADLDNDGWPDLAITNGHVVDRQDQVDRYTGYRQRLLLLRNREGRQFSDETVSAGSGFTDPAVGRGLASGDFDGDGRVDLVAVDLEGPVRLLMNRIPHAGAWIGFRLQGTRSNRMALGARVRILAGGRTQVSECRTSGSYFSASSPTVHFGLGAATGPVDATIRWPSGKSTRLEALAANRYYSVDEGRGIVR